MSLSSERDCVADDQIHAAAQTLAPSRGEPKTTIQKEKEILSRHPPPKHWKTPEPSKPLGTLRRIVFNVLCLTSYGHAGMEPVWASIKLEEEGDESVWAEGIRQVCGRFNNMLVVVRLHSALKRLFPRLMFIEASLLLATSAVFMTTSPPRPSIINYTLRGPYLCILGAFGLLLGGVIVASACVIVAGRARPDWSEHVLYANRLTVYCTLITLSYPFFSIGVATLLLAFGVLSAAWCAEDHGVQGAAVLLLLLPLSMGVLFAVSSSAGSTKHGVRKDSSDSSLEKGR